MQSFPLVLIRLEQIDIASSFQPRVQTNESVAEEYAVLLRGSPCPKHRAADRAREGCPDCTQGIRLHGPRGNDYPIVFGGPKVYFLADGFTRYRAHEINGSKTFEAEVRTGNARDAKLFAIGANAMQWQSRTPEDKRRVVTELLADPEWGQWSDREIARRCRVGHHLVGIVRQELRGSASGRCAQIGRKAKRRGKIIRQKPKSLKLRGQEEDWRIVLEAVEQSLSDAAHSVQEAEALASGLPEQARQLRESLAVHLPALQASQEAVKELADELIGGGDKAA